MLADATASTPKQAWGKLAEVAHVAKPHAPQRLALLAVTGERVTFTYKEKFRPDLSSIEPPALSMSREVYQFPDLLIHANACIPKQAWGKLAEVAHVAKPHAPQRLALLAVTGERVTFAYKEKFRL